MYTKHMNTANISTIPAQASDGLAARRATLDMLQLVLQQRKPLEQAADECKALRALTPQNKAFALRLTKTVCRRLGQLDDLIAHFLKSSLPLDATEIGNILRLGMAETLFAGIPAHASVNSAVELAKETHFPGLSGLVNAVLKRASKEAADYSYSQDSFTLILPEWFRTELVSAYGEETARAIHAAQLTEPPLDLSAKTPTTAMAEKLGAELLPTGSLRLAQSPALETLDGYRQGEWWVQDAAAALPAKLLGDVKGSTVLDICAAPGGKTAQLATRGANVIAVDRSAKRLERLNENLLRLHLKAEVLAADATNWQPTQQFSHIMLDAPCSATGTLRRNPDVVLHRNCDDITKLCTLQTRLLERAFSWLSQGGMLIYAVCSLLPAEGERQIELLLKRHADAKLLPVNPDEVGSLSEIITSQGYLRSLPCHMAELGGMDGFFAARLTRTT